MDGSVGLPFLKTRTTFASFQSWGMEPWAREELNRSRIGETSSYVQSLRILVGSPSGPGAFVPSSCFRASLTSFSVNIISVRFGSMFTMVSGVGSDVCLLKIL